MTETFTFSSLNPFLCVFSSERRIKCSFIIPSQRNSGIVRSSVSYSVMDDVTGCLFSSHQLDRGHYSFILYHFLHVGAA